MKDKQEMAEHVKQFIMQELADVAVNTTPKTPKPARDSLMTDK